MTDPAVIELRIHGVGGGTVEDIIGGLDPEPEPIAGDSTAFFQRATTSVGEPGRIVEAYVWGGFSGRNAIRSLWLLLLPFTVINIAGWMVLPSNHPAIQAIERGLVRVLAFAHTILIVVWLAALGAEIFDGAAGGGSVAWALLLPGLAIILMAVASTRSAAYEKFEAAADDLPTVTLQEQREDSIGPASPGFWASSDFIKAQRYRHFAVGVATLASLLGGWLWATTASELGPQLTVAGLGLIAIEISLAAFRVSWAEGLVAAVVAAGLLALGLDAVIAAEAPTATGWPAAADATPVLSEAPMGVLMGSLVVLGLLAAVGVAGWLGRKGTARTWPHFTRLWMWRLLGIVGLGSVAAWLIAAAGGEDWLSAGTRITLLWVGAGGLGLIIYLMSRRARWLPLALIVATIGASTPLILSGSSESSWLWAAPGALLGALFVTAFAATGRRDQYRWLPVATVAALSFLPVAGTYAGWSIIAQARIGNSNAVPDGYRWILAAFTAVVLVAVVSTLIHLLWRRYSVWAASRIVGEYGGSECGPRLARGAARWRSLSDTTRVVDLVLTLPTWGLAIFMAGALSRVQRPTQPLWSLDRIWNAAFTVDFPGSWSWLYTLAMVMGAVLPLIAVGALLAAGFSPRFRRIVGIVWDVGTFWPRRFHPMAPPAYSERAVPEIADRVRELTADGCVLISGHSQGAVLTAAAVAQLAGDSGSELNRVAILTRGAPLGVFYRRFWPGTFGGGLYKLSRDLLRGAAADGAERWRNAYRLTDPIAEEIFVGPDEDMSLPSPDLRLADPPAPAPGATECEGPRKHSGYLRDSAVQRAQDEMAGSLLSEL